MVSGYSESPRDPSEARPEGGHDGECLVDKSAPMGPSPKKKCRSSFMLALHQKEGPRPERGSKRVGYNVNWVFSEDEDFGGSMSPSKHGST